MKKAIVFLAILAVFLAGCGTNNVTEKKDVSQDSIKQSEITEKQEITTDLNKNLVPISTKTFDGIWKLTTYQNPDSVKKITEWKPKPLDYKGGLQKKWSLPGYVSLEFSDDRINRPYRSYPNGWGVYGLKSTIEGYLHGIINIEDGKYKYFYNNLGITDGEYLYTDDAINLTPSVCVRISDLNIIWEGSTIGSSCSYFPSAHISGDSLLYIQTCPSSQNQNIKRINPEDGKSLWTLELDDSKEIDGNKYGITLRESTSKSLIVRINEYPRINGNKTRSLLKGYYKINPSDGSVSKINIDPKYGINEFLRCSNEILMCTNNLEVIEYNPENDSVSVHDISKLLEMKSLTDISSMSYYIQNTKLLLTVVDSTENTSHFQYFTYDFKSKKLASISKENMDSVKVVNGSLIVEYGKKSECIDPETQETLCTIEHKNGGSVQWLDWRGVLVYQDNQLACYAPK